ncbi:MAG TPA: MFS transporter [Burkholderiales bacterium]|nr:MFS transporter [Burkholderiales bacterium]
MSIQLLVALTVLVHLSFAGCRFIISLTAIHHGATPFTVGVVMSLLTVIAMLFAVRWGRWVDRIGVRGPMLAGAAAIFAAMALAWAVPRLETLFVASPLAGSGFFLFHIAAGQAAAVIGRPQDRVRNFGLLALAFSTSGFLGPVLAGFAIDGIGHRGAMLALSAAALATVAALAARRADIPRPAAAAAALQGEQRIADFLRIPGFRLLFIVSGALSMAWDLFAFVIPIHGSQIGLTASTIGVILGAFGAAVFVVRLMLPLVAHRLDEWRVLIAAMLLSGSTLLVFPLVDGVPLLMALAFILGVGLGGTQPLIMALLYEKAPAGRGAEVLSVRTWLINFSQTSAPLASGALGAALGMLPVYWAMGVTLLVAGFVALRRKDGGQ